MVQVIRVTHVADSNGKAVPCSKTPTTWKMRWSIKGRDFTALAMVFADDARRSLVESGVNGW